MKPLQELTFVVFDVESLGLLGEGFAFAAAVYGFDPVYGPERRCLAEICVACPPTKAGGTYSESDREWIEANVQVPASAIMVDSVEEVRALFWKFWKEWKSEDGSVVLAADVAWPFEAGFLLEGVLESSPRRKHGPYPLVDISNILLAAGMDPTASFTRLPEELPAHNPLADVRQSARLLFEAIDKLGGGHELGRRLGLPMLPGQTPQQRMDAAMVELWRTGKPEPIKAAMEVFRRNAAEMKEMIREIETSVALQVARVEELVAQIERL